MKSTTVEEKSAGLARRAHGVVTRRELLAAGISAKEIEWRLRTGALIAVFRGVYRVGHTAPSLEAYYLAAVRACGDGALLSGTAAAHLLGLSRGQAPPPEATSPAPLRVAGVKTRRGRRQATTWRGIPVTTPAETLVDLAAVVDETELARACHEASVRHQITPKQVEAVLARRPNAKGAGQLRAIMRGEVKVTLSKLEQRFLERLQEVGLPLVLTPAHRRARQLPLPPLPPLPGERPAREREAYAREDNFRRYTWADVFRSPAPMLAELRALLRPAPSALPSPR